MYHKPSEKTMDIHKKIITVCEYLRTRYASKRHGGFNIYEDDKIVALTDTCVPNVDLSVKILEEQEYVFGCNYDGHQITYHPGRWEEYLSDLYEKALEIKQKIHQVQTDRLNREREECERSASEAANNVFC